MCSWSENVQTSEQKNLCSTKNMFLNMSSCNRSISRKKFLIQKIPLWKWEIWVLPHQQHSSRGVLWWNMEHSALTICLKVILRTRDIVCLGFPDTLCFNTGTRYIQAVIVFQWFFLQPTRRASCIISGGYTRCNFYACIHDTYLVLNESTWQSLERQQEIMVLSSAWREIYLQMDK